MGVSDVMKKKDTRSECIRTAILIIIWQCGMRVKNLFVPNLFKVQIFLEVYNLKKSIRILSLLMAFAMLIGSFSVMGSAYEEYKGTAIADSYNDVDSPEFTIEQYASMALDELDRILAKEKLVVNIYIGTLDISSVDTTLDSVDSLLTSVSSLLPLLGDASVLPDLTGPIETVRRSNATDLTVIHGLLDFISNLSGIVEKYVNGSLNLGILDSFIADFVFDVRELALGLIYGLSLEGREIEYDYFDEGPGRIPAKYAPSNENAALNSLQNILNEFVLGKWTKLDDLFGDIDSHVDFEDYDFGTDKCDIDTYDYYGWVHHKQWVTIGLGGTKIVADGAAAPAPDYSAIDIGTSKSGYEFIENLMQKAYNDLLVPVLNTQTRKWLREECGFVYDNRYNENVYDEASKSWIPNPEYDPLYDGHLVNGTDSLTAIAPLFQYDHYVQKVTVTEGKTFVDDFNRILGEFLENIATNGVDGHTWTWDYSQGNAKLFDNICNVGKYIINVTGGLFFSDSFECPSVDEVNAMGKQEVVALIMREILNNSVDYIYIDDTYTNAPDVAYRAVEQLAWQDIPQYTYTKPVLSDFATTEEYYDAVVEKMLDILFDIAVYNLNQGFDMVPAKGNDPVAGEGLLQYQGDNGSYKNNLVYIAEWAIKEYGAILALDFICDDAGTHDADDVWTDIETILNAIIPIKAGNEPWISNTIASQEIVTKSLVFDYLLKPIYYLDATNFAEIFATNPNGAFAKHNGVAIIMSLLENIFNLIAPGVFQSQETIDGLLNNQLLGKMLSDFIKSLGTKSFTASTGATLQGRGANIAKVALPVVCMILGLSDDQEFEEMEIYMPTVIAANGGTPTFQVVNGSSGINTAYTDKNGNTTQDNLYTYKIKNTVVKTYDASGNNTAALTDAGLAENSTISGGDSINVTLNGNLSAGQLIEYTVNYFVLGEDGTSITDEALSKTVFAYVGTADKDDDAIEKVDPVNGREVKYEASIYLSQGDGLDDIESYSIRVEDTDSGATGTASVSSVSFTSAKYGNAYPFAVKNTDASQISQSMTGEGGLYFLNPFDLATKADGSYYERFEEFYQTDEKGDLILDENGDPIKVTTAPFDNGGVPNGEYTATTSINVAGTAHTVTTKIHLYNDYGLVSLFNNSVAANRQLANYDRVAGEGAAEGLFTAYTEALKDAARLVLEPKVGTEFQSKIVASSDAYENKYEEYAEALEAAIEALEPYALNAGTSKLEAALNNYSGLNYDVVNGEDGPYKVDVEYYENDYIHFGMRDYVPHTYNRYRGARDRVHDLINSQNFFVPAPFEEGYEPSNEELAAYNEAVLAYQEAVENKGVIGSIEETYAIHMLNLTGGRLIRLQADTSKLQQVYAMCVTNAEILDAASYTEESYTNYMNAKTFTEKVLATDILKNGEPNLRPSMVNAATTELMHSWKKLETCANYEKLDAAITAAEVVLLTYGDTANGQTTYTEESYQAFLDAYNEAKNLSRDLGSGDQDYIDEVATTLEKAAKTEAQGGGLIEATSKEVVFEFVTEDPGVFFDQDYNLTYTPTLTTEYTDVMGGVTLADGTPVDGFIVGFGSNVYSEDEVAMIFSTIENGTLYAEPTELGCYATGSLVQILDADGNPVATYLICIRGDVNGDGLVNDADAGDIQGVANWLDGYDYMFDTSLNKQVHGWACDINLDYGVDDGDKGIALNVGISNNIIDQVNGGVL